MRCPKCKKELTEVCVFERVRRFMKVTGEGTPEMLWGAGYLTVLEGEVGPVDDRECVEICCPHCDTTLTTVKVDYEPKEG